MRNELLTLPINVKFNHTAWEARMEEELKGEERDALFSLGIDLVMNSVRDSEFGLVPYKFRVRIIH